MKLTRCKVFESNIPEEKLENFLNLTDLWSSEKALVIPREFDIFDYLKKKEWKKIDETNFSMTMWDKIYYKHDVFPFILGIKYTFLHGHQGTLLNLKKYYRLDLKNDYIQKGE